MEDEAEVPVEPAESTIGLKAKDISTSVYHVANRLLTHEFANWL
jgi:hypothetical protein